MKTIMKQISFLLNDRPITLPLQSGKSVLDTLRNDLDLFGTKEGCREGECGACTVILGRIPTVPYRSMPSCLLSTGQIDGAHLVTIEGLDRGEPNRIQQAFLQEGASQCGYCTPGFIVSLTGYLMSGRMITLEGALNSLDGNICRCTGYASIRRAVEWAVSPLLGKTPTIDELISLEILPDSFAKSYDYLQNAVKQKETKTDDAPEGPVVAGGTDLYVQKGDELTDQAPRFLIPESSPITLTEDQIVIPATASMEQFRLDPHLNQQYPGLDEKMLLLPPTSSATGPPSGATWSTPPPSRTRRSSS
jgi:xanthine dehydrogenase small subunit